VSPNIKREWLSIKIKRMLLPFYAVSMLEGMAAAGLVKNTRDDA
jgi:hypothetical protein